MQGRVSMQKFGVRFETAKRVRKSLEEEISGFKKQCFLAACSFRCLVLLLLHQKFTRLQRALAVLLPWVVCVSLASFSYL